MEKQISKGDLVKSIAGRDKDNFFLVVDVKDKFAYVVDGKVHTVKQLKKKSKKHLEKVSTATLIEYAEKILEGKAVSNKKIYSAIKARNYKE